MKFQLLISTVDSRFQGRKLQLDSPYLVIDQLSKPESEKTQSDNIFSYAEKGLSKSRNHALGHAEGEICLLSDDDLYYKEHMEHTILEAFESNPDADIITFQIETPEGIPFKNYSDTQFRHNKRTIMRAASVEIAFKKNSIKKASLRFDEHFGLGAEFPTGEENIFLSDALDKGLKILYVPKPVVIHPAESSGEEYDKPELVQAKGAMFERMFGWQAYAVSFLFALKKYRHSPHSLFGFYKLMLRGTKNYRRKKPL